jgi:hypothetical protein
MTAAASAADLETFYRADLAFHRTLWQLSGNRFLEKALDNTVVPLFAFFIMKTPPGSADDLIISVERHRAVISAIRSGDNARKTMEDAITFFGQQEQRLLFEGRRHAGMRLVFVGWYGELLKAIHLVAELVGNRRSSVAIWPEPRGATASFVILRAQSMLCIGG